MTIALATAWNPRGELTRFIKLLPRFEEAYLGVAFSLPPDAEPQLVNQLIDLPLVTVTVTEDWSHGRFQALKSAAGLAAGHVQYADFDRILRWIEMRPQEFHQVLDQIEQHDCLIIGRSPASYQTHPRALYETEAVSNRVISHLIGETMDFSAGSKCFSILACETILQNSKPGNALGTDAEWPLILKLLGFSVDYIEVDGLDWESADRYQDEAANQASQKEAASLYDMDPENWSRRVAVAMEIIHVGLQTIARDLAPYSDSEH